MLRVGGQQPSEVVRMQYADRRDAGRRLAAEVRGRVRGSVLVLALPRGGVPVAAAVAEALGAPLDVIGVRKLGAPTQPEFGIGAIAEGGVRVLDDALVRRLGVSAAQLDALIEREETELRRRVAAYRGGRALPDLTGRIAVIVDDGLATGVTARAAVRAARQAGATRVLLAVPVASAQGREALAREADEVVCPLVPERFAAVGQWYVDFDQTSDEEVLAALQAAGSTSGGQP
jgi:putative phosphoribosyl transferase